MNFLLKCGRRMVATLVFFAAAASMSAADPRGDLAAFSSFKQVDLDALAGGGMLAEKGPAMPFKRGLAAETCFVVHAPIAKAVEALRNWTPAGHRGLNVEMHGLASGKSAGFGKLGSAPESLPPSGTDDPAAFWTALLRQRAAAFQSGGLAALPPYNTGGERVTAAGDAAGLLKDWPKVREFFAPVIAKSGIEGGGGDSYWELVKTEAGSALTLGSVAATPANGGWQVLDLQYYASSEFYVGMTFYQLWPVGVGGEDCTLVWRCNAVSTPEAERLGGVERRAAGVAYKNRMRKYADALRDDMR